MRFIEIVFIFSEFLSFERVKFYFINENERLNEMEKEGGRVEE